MWVEIIGLPGVGKTTLIKQNYNEIAEHFLMQESRRPNVLQKIIARSLYHGYFYWKLSDKSLAKKLAYRLSFRFLQSPKRNIFFYDSGLLQQILENGIETNFEGFQEKLSVLNGLKAPDILLYIEDDLENICERELNRNPRRYSFKKNEIFDKYKKAQSIIEKDFLPKAAMVYRLNLSNPNGFSEFIQHVKSS